MIAVTFAVAEESRDFAQAARAAGLPVRILHTGVGESVCRERFQAFFADGPAPKLLISSGFAGGLDPALPIGGLVLSTNFSDERLLKKLAAFLENPPFQFHCGILTTQARVIESAAEKHAIFTQTGAGAVDMETAHLFAECQARGIPVLSLRAISDTATQAMPVPHAVWFDAAKQQPRILALLGWLVMHPAAIPAFARFVRGISLTRRQLTRGLLAVVPLLTDPP
jgi:adenosylhomocysteine nucleosidase